MHDCFQLIYIAYIKTAYSLYKNSLILVYIRPLIQLYKIPFQMLQ